MWVIKFLKINFRELFAKIMLKNTGVFALESALFNWLSVAIMPIQEK